MEQQGRSEMVVSAARQACRELAYIMEKTDDQQLRETLRAAIGAMCAKFQITAFGSLP